MEAHSSIALRWRTVLFLYFHQIEHERVLDPFLQSFRVLQHGLGVRTLLPKVFQDRAIPGIVQPEVVIHACVAEFNESSRRLPCLHRFGATAS